MICVGLALLPFNLWTKKQSFRRVTDAWLMWNRYLAPGCSLWLLALTVDPLEMKQRLGKPGKCNLAAGVCGCFGMASCDLIPFRRAGKGKGLVKEAICSPAAWQEELYVSGWFADD